MLGNILLQCMYGDLYQLLGLCLRILSRTVVLSNVVRFDRYPDTIRVCWKYNILWRSHYVDEVNWGYVYFAWRIFANKVDEVTLLCSALMEGVMDPLLIKLISAAAAFVSVIVGFRVVIAIYGKERCVRCYERFRKRTLVKAPGFRGDFFVCKPCAGVIEQHIDQQ